MEYPQSAAGAHPSWPVSRILAALDLAAFWLSPLAVLGIAFLALIGAVRFGEHQALLTALAADGVETWGIWYAPSGDSRLGVVEFDQEQHGLTGVVVDTRYYTAEILAALKQGERVLVRYLYLPKHDPQGFLAGALPQVQRYTGHLAGLFWPFLVCWLVVVVHPEWLFLGFADAPDRETVGCR